MSKDDIFSSKNRINIIGRLHIRTRILSIEEKLATRKGYNRNIRQSLLHATRIGWHNLSKKKNYRY